MFEYIRAFFIIFAIDSIYLFLISNAFSSMVKSIQHESISIRYGSAFIVYALLAACLVNFTNKNSIKKAALLGAIIYGVFDFTNYAIFRNYNIILAMIDTVWGAVLMGLSAFTYHSIKL